jgi:hypothetical protein
MPRNESNRDRDIRVLIGAVLMYLAVFIIPGAASFVVGGVALVLFATAVAGYCPLYRLAGINTCSVHERAADQKVYAGEPAQCPDTHAGGSCPKT